MKNNLLLGTAIVLTIVTNVTRNKICAVLLFGVAVAIIVDLAIRLAKRNKQD